MKDLERDQYDYEMPKINKFAHDLAMKEEQDY